MKLTLILVIASTLYWLSARPAFAPAKLTILAAGERVEQLDGKLNLAWVAAGSPRVEELSVVEYFRSSHHHPGNTYRFCHG